MFNYTASYRVDATLSMPYGLFVPFDNASLYQDLPPKQNYTEGKNKSVAWFVSNCDPKNNRMRYAKELAQHIDVDIYGKCGHMNWTCKKEEREHCWEKIRRDYKFYLAFENVNCKDYITEKFFDNALKHDIVPIVMGASQEQYKQVAPLNSYIHVEDFDSPKELAAYLHKLNKDDALYNNYFRWKGSGEFIDTKFFCRLCALVHDDSRLAWYENVNQWWRGVGKGNVCVYPTPGNPYAFWRLEKRQSFADMGKKDARFNPTYVNRTDNVPSVLPNQNVVCK